MQSQILSYNDRNVLDMPSNEFADKLVSFGACEMYLKQTENKSQKCTYRWYWISKMIEAPHDYIIQHTWPWPLTMYVNELD